MSAFSSFCLTKAIFLTWSLTVSKHYYSSRRMKPMYPWSFAMKKSFSILKSSPFMLRQTRDVTCVSEFATKISSHPITLPGPKLAI